MRFHRQSLAEYNVDMKRSVLGLALGTTFTIVSAVGAQRPAGPAMEVYKSPTCGCCSKWVEHVRQAGFTVRVTDLDDMSLDALKTKNGVPRTAQSCHTALVAGYVVEGHVPASEVRRLIKERPAIQGIAVGGMPIGSPGMEVAGTQPQTYNVVTFDKQGGVRVFSTQNR
jgi:hypothetical protein